MGKSDKSIHNICIAAIKRACTQPYDFKWTRFYEEPKEFALSYPKMAAYVEENELPICATIVHARNWSLLTTRRLFTMDNGQLTKGDIEGSKNQSHGDFKGAGTHERTNGAIQLFDGTKMTYIIETGRASMVMIYGIRTIININGRHSPESDS